MIIWFISSLNLRRFKSSQQSTSKKIKWKSHRRESIMLSCIFFLWFAVLIVRSKLQYVSCVLVFLSIIPAVRINGESCRYWFWTRKGTLLYVLQCRVSHHRNRSFCDSISCSAVLESYFANGELWLPSQQFLTQLNSCCYSLELERQYREETRRIEEQR